MKDQQLSRFVELAVFDLGEMKAFADFLKREGNATHEYTEHTDTWQVTITHSHFPPLRQSQQLQLPRARAI